MNEPPTQGTSDLALLRRIDRACLAFERSWRQGTPTPIEGFLREAAEADRPYLLAELLALEWSYRRQRGDRLERQGYLTQFSPWSGVVEAAWARFTGGSAVAGTADSSLPPTATPTAPEAGQGPRYQRTQ